MKKLFFCFLLLTALAITVNAAQTESASEKNPVEQLTGKVWQSSTPENKRAVIFGIDTAVAIEKAINEKAKEKIKNPKDVKKMPHTLSVFEKSWMEAFKNMTRDEIVKAVDDWYTANPDSAERPVMDVIWYEIIVPKVNAAK